MERQATLLTPGFLESVNKAAQVLVGKYDALREQADKLDRDLIAAEKSRASAQRGERAIDAEVRSELAKRPQSNPRKCSIVSRFDEKYARLQHSLKGEELLTWPIGKKTHDLKPPASLFVYLRCRQAWLGQGEQDRVFVHRESDRR